MKLDLQLVRDGERINLSITDWNGVTINIANVGLIYRMVHLYLCPRFNVRQDFSRITNICSECKTTATELIANRPTT